MYHLGLILLLSSDAKTRISQYTRFILFSSSDFIYMPKGCLNFIFKPLLPVEDLLLANMIICCVYLT